MSKHSIALGELPDWEGAPFNLAKWTREHRHVAMSNLTQHTVKGYRMRRARQLLNSLNAGRLAPSAAAGVERDYKKELAKLRKAGVK